MDEKSYMLAVPVDAQELSEPQELVQRISQTEGLKLADTQMADGALALELEYGGETYRAEVFPTEFELPELYRCQHLFSDVDVQALGEAAGGLAVVMDFGEEPLVSYHLQLKLIHALLPEVLAVLDDSSEKLLSGRWVALAAESAVPPAPRYIYTAQAVSGEDDCVWLHTHGLNRCGLPELEILSSTRETYSQHYNVLETLANRMLELEEPLQPFEPLYLARLTADVALVVTLIPWQEAVRHYDSGMLGGADDREESHNEDTCVVFAYPSRADYEAGRYVPIAAYDEILHGNPIYLISNAETERMRALAAERLPYLLRAMQGEGNRILVKIGLLVDEEYRTEDNSREHIWFELLECDGGTMRAKLTQEPYYVGQLHEGDEGEYGVEDLTDWIIYAPERRVTPDDVYLLEL